MFQSSIKALDMRFEGRLHSRNPACNAQNDKTVISNIHSMDDVPLQMGFLSLLW